jgi:hypothetical protein
MELAMKNAEDEAFDELAKKQGSWGGGFQAKRAMAKARIDDDDDIQVYKRPWVGLTDEEVELYWDWEDWQTGAGRSTIFEMVRDIEARLRSKNT